MYIFFYYFLLFLIYSILGWIIETIMCSLYQKKIVLNRGFLIGPYCPIYGTAAIVMILFLTEYKNDLFNLFIMAVVYASLIEYFGSYLMEKIFNARWWDYTNQKFNLNGRICLKNCIGFGILGILLLYYVNPFITYLIDLLDKKILILISLTLFIFFIIDNIITLVVLFKLKINIRNINGDATEEIDRDVKKILSKYHFSYKRLFKAFPKFKSNSKKSNIVIDKLKTRIDEIEKLNMEYKKKIKNIKSEIKYLRKNNEHSEIKNKKIELKDVRRKKIK